MKKFLIGATFAAFAVTSAQAATITTTWTGTVRTGSDLQNYFGGGSLVGKAFTAIYVFDDALGQTVVGSTDRSLRNAAIAASLTINGLTYSYSVPTLTYSELYADQESGFSWASSTAKVSIDLYLSNGVYDVFSAPYGNPSFADYSGSVANALSNTGVFSFGPGLSNRLNLTNSTYSIRTTNATGAVPEPATWAMMVGGFGAMGGALRYRRRKAGTSFA